MKRKWIIFSIALIGTTVIALAGKLFINNRQTNTGPLPEAKDEFKKLYSRFLDPSATMYMKGIITLYDDSTEKNIKERTDFLLFKQGDNIYSSLSSLRTYCDGKYVAELDTVNMMLDVFKVNDSLLKVIKNPVMPFDNLFTDTAKMQMRGTVSEDAGGRMIQLQTDFIPEVKCMKVFYNPSDYILRSSKIYWWQTPGLMEQEKDAPVWVTKIEYSYPVDSGPDIPAMMRDIFTIKDGECIPAEKYKNYRVRTNL